MAWSQNHSLEYAPVTYDVILRIQTQSSVIAEKEGGKLGSSLRQWRLRHLHLGTCLSRIKKPNSEIRVLLGTGTHNSTNPTRYSILRTNWSGICPWPFLCHIWITPASFWNFCVIDDPLNYHFEQHKLWFLLKSAMPLKCGLVACLATLMLQGCLQFSFATPLPQTPRFRWNETKYV